MPEADQNEVLLEVSNLYTRFSTPDGTSRAVNGVDFQLRRGETLAIVGESGCGKSVTAQSIMQILQKPSGSVEAGKVLFEGTDILELPEPRKREIRGNRISMIFQEPQSSLNPVYTIGNQLEEVFRVHRDMSRDEIRSESVRMLELVGIPDPEKRLSEYPHQLSGGMKQRVMIAMAAACHPDVLIADEPTTALDVTIQAQVLSLIDELGEELNTAVLLITHDLGVVKQVADRVGVMYTGRIVESASCDELFAHPLHPYTRKLLESIPSSMGRGEDLSVIPGSVPSAVDLPPGCTFADRCFAAQEDCRESFPPLEEVSSNHFVACYHWETQEEERQSEPTEEAKAKEHVGDDLRIKALKVYYPIRKGIFKTVVGQVRAVDGVNLLVERGRTTALVGESGCGKTTLGKAIVGLEEINGGTIHYGDLDVSSVKGWKARELRRQIQIVFQDPYSSLNPRMRVQDIVGEGLKIHNLSRNKNQYQERIRELLQMVGLSPGDRLRYPHEFSGGQRQRICIARALSVDPECVVCDEATSALDVSVQAQILNLLTQLQGELGLTYLFITHDLSVVEYFADYIYVMYVGEIVEEGPVEEIFGHPRHPYTRALLSSAPKVDETTGLEKIHLEGPVPSPIDPPAGCRFHPRCPEVRELCRHKTPHVFKSDEGGVCCHMYDEAEAPAWE